MSGQTFTLTNDDFNKILENSQLTIESNELQSIENNELLIILEKSCGFRLLCKVNKDNGISILYNILRNYWTEYVMTPYIIQNNERITITYNDNYTVDQFTSYFDVDKFIYNNNDKQLILHRFYIDYNHH
jgi:hypothetical protein